MKDRHIQVVPEAGGCWSVSCEPDLEALLFLSGARAEAQARALARRLSDAGQEVELTVRDRSRAVIGQVRYRARSG